MYLEKLMSYLFGVCARKFNSLSTPKRTVVLMNAIAIKRVIAEVRNQQSLKTVVNLKGGSVSIESLYRKRRSVTISGLGKFDDDPDITSNWTGRLKKHTREIDQILNPASIDDETETESRTVRTSSGAIGPGASGAVGPGAFGAHGTCQIFTDVSFD
jgi:hypothetical protein